MNVFGFLSFSFSLKRYFYLQVHYFVTLMSSAVSNESFGLGDIYAGLIMTCLYISKVFTIQITVDLGGP